MSIGFLNLAMLAGLLAVGLPVLAHLLSKRRYDVEHWGAMQFLRLGQRTRRKIQIQDWLLLFLRMLLLAVLALALARPWGQGGVFGALANSVSRDVVFIIDGSGSMDWRGGQQIPHQRAIQWVHEALEDLNSGDTVAIIDARARNRRLIHPPTSDFARVRAVLDEIPGPTGSSDLTAAVLDGVQILSATANVTREVIVLTDLQAEPWNLDDPFALERIDDVASQAAVPPSISVVDLSGDEGERINFSVDRISLSRELTVPGFPIRFQTSIRQSSGEVAQKEVFLSVNGQRAAESTRTVTILPDGEALVDFTHVFPENGYYTINISVEPDKLPGDDAASAIVLVEDGIRVLLVDGDIHQDETKSETFFLSAAFASSGEKTRWIRATRIAPAELDSKTLSENRVVIFCNVPGLNEQQQSAVVDFVKAGGGMVVAPGNQIDADSWNRLEAAEGQPLLPFGFESIESEKLENDGANQINIDSLSMKAPWLERFKKESGVDFWSARFSSWWNLVPHDDLNPQDAKEKDLEELLTESSAESTSSTIARLTNGRPFMVTSQLADGTVLMLATPLDADWSTLPARTDFVPFVHELVFQLANLDTQHNVMVGSSLRVELADDERPRDFTVTGPTGEEGTPILRREGSKSFAVSSETAIAGNYSFTNKTEERAKPIPFVVADDAAESNLTRLDQIGWETIAADDRMSKVESMSELTTQNQATHARTELWWLLLVFILLMLVCEVYLTRRMVQGGHTDLEELPVA